MLQIRLHPHVAPAGSIDVWLGISDLLVAPALRWTVDGQPVVPEVLRPLEAIRTGEFAPDPPRARMFTGGFRFAVDGPEREVHRHTFVGVAPGPHVVLARSPDGREQRVPAEVVAGATSEVTVSVV